MVREVMSTPSLGRGRSSYLLCPCLLWVQESAMTSSNDVITRKADWFAHQCRTGSEICQYRKVSRQVHVVGTWFLQLSL